MRFVYLDAALTDAMGRRAIHCRLVREELRRLVIPTRVFAGMDVGQELREGCDALPLFRNPPRDPDAIIGWLMGFHAAAKVAAEDIGRLRGLVPDDLIYLHHADPAGLMALIIWAATVGAGRLPIMIVDIGADPGLEPRIGDTRLELRDPRKDPRALLYRYAATRMPVPVARRLRLVTCHRETSKAFRSLLGRKVGTMPMAFRATGRRNRAGKRPIVVSLITDETGDGSGVAPLVAAELLRTRSDIRLETHAGEPGDTYDLLERTDLVVFAYDPAHHAISYSSLAAEAIASGVPLVVPDGTPMANLLGEFESSGSVFGEFTAAAIAAAAQRVLDPFESCASAAYAASERWELTQGTARMVQALLGLADAMTEADVAGQ